MQCAGGPERGGLSNNENVISKSGPWKVSQDGRKYRQARDEDGFDDVVVLTLVDDC